MAARNLSGNRSKTPHTQASTTYSAPSSPNEAEALILFVDIRGFTKWSEANEVFAQLPNFVGPFLNLIRSQFSDPHFVKPLGDGAMIVKTFNKGSIAISKLLKDVLDRIASVNHGFKQQCDKFAREVGHRTDLNLGWGVVRGAVKVLDGDYIGSNVNKCARLCDAARPFGIVIDRDDFLEAPTSAKLDMKFWEQTRKLSGLVDDVRVWATEEIVTSFVPRERLRQTPEVHVAGVCIDAKHRDGLKIMIAKRAMSRRLFPGLYEGCGGQLRADESFEDGVKRHFRLEMGIEVDPYSDIHCFYQIREPHEPLIPGIRFLCQRVDHKVAESKNHDHVYWITETELRNMSETLFIHGMKSEFLQLLDQYHKTRR